MEKFESGIYIPNPQHWSELRKTNFPLESVTLVTCLVHVGAGVADGGYGKLVLQPQSHHTLNYKKNELATTFHTRKNNLFLSVCSKLASVGIFIYY
jgi:hypothetical protein